RDKMIPASKPYTTTEMAYVSDKDSGIGMQQSFWISMTASRSPRNRIERPCRYLFLRTFW
ncbi:MAG: hypothetical protein VXV97_16020, partial [Pseudomonadota bacterium]|nr:hypothetical protein [Pseudomonadota bacterium]